MMSNTPSAAPMGTSTTITSAGPLVIQVHSAEFTIDVGHLTKQDPYIKVKIGLHKEKTTAKTRAGKSATWNETLTFTKLDRIEGTDHTVHITARDKNLLKNNTIGQTSLPLSNLLSLRGQRGIDLFDKKDASKLVGHLQITVLGGEAVAGQGLTSGHDKSLTSGHTGHTGHHGHHGKHEAAAVAGQEQTKHGLGHHGVAGPGTAVGTDTAGYGTTGTTGTTGMTGMTGTTGTTGYGTTGTTGYGTTGAPGYGTGTGTGTTGYGTGTGTGTGYGTGTTV